MTNKPTSESEELRDRIWDLHIRWLSERQIASALKISKTAVHHHLQVILRRKAGEFTADMDREGRKRHYYAKIRDGFGFAISQASFIYDRAVKEYESQVAEGKHPSIARTVPPLLAMITALEKMRVHLGLIQPTPDQVYIEQMIKQIVDQYQKIQEHQRMERLPGPRFENTP